MSVYSFHANLSNGEEISLEKYKGDVMLIINTASKCGLTPQYEGLENLYNKYKNEGFTILAFPCNQFGGQEPGTDDEIKNFCSVNYNVTFPLFQKVEVNGENAHPLYKYLREQKPQDVGMDESSRLYKHLKNKVPELLEESNIRWNFTKFLIDQNGEVVTRFAPTTSPEEIEGTIKELLFTYK
ncbi:glutathione peroxidase [Alkalihalobacillus sp. BA299]|uniref:glutathione peroxidase n=1 Tax=Alkalihalobacillus sp. BA299 TaxID=2815938 RepID=UPI001AD9F9CE|nr:glutathione peroxidase [Alkalihalobacillus sp. BA299]